MNRHMNKYIVSIALIAGMVLAFQTATGRFAPPATALGTIDLPRVIDALDEWKAEVARATASSEQFATDIETRTKEAEVLRADLEDFVPGTDKFEDAQRSLKRATINLKAFMLNAERRELATKTRSVLRIYDHIRTSAGQLADRDGYGLILVDDSAIAINEQSADVLGEISSRRVLYAQPTLDVSDVLVAFMNEQWKAAH